MPVFDGQAVNAAITNPAHIDRQVDDTAFGIYTLANGAPASGPTIVNIQGAINHLMSTTGATPTADGTTYTSHQRITDGDNHPTAISELDTAFHPSTGHKHTGVTGDGPLLPGSSITGNPLRGTFKQGTDVTGVTGSSTDVSTQFTSAVPSTGPAIEGVVSVTPFNRCVVRQASGPSEDDSYLDAGGNVVYGRLTNTGGVGGTWTLSFFSLIAGVETAFSFGSASDVRFYYQQLFNPLVDAPVYSELAFIPSDNVTADVITATTALQGKVKLASATPADVGATGSAGTANATVANADHVHKGVHSVDNFFGDITVAGAGGTTVGDSLNTITITSPSFGTTAASVGAANNGGSAVTMSKSDHVHQGVHSADGFFGDVTFAGAGGTSVGDAANVITITSPTFGTTASQVGAASNGGSATTMSKSDHVHQGVTSFAKTGGTARYGVISITPGTGVTITDNADGTFTIASTGGGGGGSGTPEWIPDDAGGPTEVFEFTVKTWQFAAGLGQALDATFMVPTSYQAGNPIKLKIATFSPSTSNTVRFETVTTLVRTGTDAFDSTTNQHTSTDQTYTNTSPAKLLHEVVLDLTDSGGLINGVAVSPGDTLKVFLQRKSTDSDTAVVRYVPSSTEVTLT